MRKARTITLLFGLACLPAFIGATTAPAREDHVALAKAAARRLHRSVDAWAAAAAQAKPTTQPTADITTAYYAFMRHALDAKYYPCAAILVPNKILSAGVLTSRGRTMSYLAGPGQLGVVLSCFERGEWTKDSLPAQGF